MALVHLFGSAEGLGVVVVEVQSAAAVVEVGGFVGPVAEG